MNLQFTFSKFIDIMRIMTRCQFNGIAVDCVIKVNTHVLLFVANLICLYVYATCFSDHFYWHVWHVN